MSDLQRLIEAVERGGDLPEILNCDPFARCMDGTHYLAALAYDGSLDAAKALHERLLQGWQRQISESNAKVYKRPNIAFFGESIDNDARAWLLAILRAVEAKGSAE